MNNYPIRLEIILIILGSRQNIVLQIFIFFIIYFNIMTTDRFRLLFERYGFRQILEKSIIY